jgi:anaerobic ribonucleoside-triphosphate reductase activating protein
MFLSSIKNFNLLAKFDKMLNIKTGGLESMNYATIKYNDIANGPGVRTSLFVSGCTHHCKGCFNEVAWDFNYGLEFTKEVMDEIVKSLEPDYITGITLLGGEPFEHVNQIGLLPLLREIKAKYPDKSIWCFSGYLFDKQILQEMVPKWPETKEMISYIDVLVDGKFVLELKDLMLKYRGSSNQRLIDVKKSLKANEVILWED